MSGALQAVFQNQRSFITIPVIGSALGGGFFAGQISTAGNGIADYNLVIGPAASALNTAVQYNTSVPNSDPTSVINGPANSATMNNANHPAAQFCEGLTIGGFSDWYQPAKNELEVCYYNLKPTTASNNTSSGINANAVPARASNYTAGTPAQTSAAAFQSGGAEALDAGAGFLKYWSSTERNGYPFNKSAFYQYVPNGNQGYSFKTNSYRVRAVRRVAV